MVAQVRGTPALAKARRRRHSSTFGGNALCYFDHLNKEKIDKISI